MFEFYCLKLCANFNFIKMINSQTFPKSGLKSNIKLLGSCIFMVFDFLIKSNLAFKEDNMLPFHYQEFLAKPSTFVIDCKSDKKLNKTFDFQDIMIQGMNSQTSMKEFVSTQNFEALAKQMESLIMQIKDFLDNFKRMLWNLERFQKTRMKRNELTILWTKFGSRVVEREKFEELCQRYRAYESMDSKSVKP